MQQIQQKIVNYKVKANEQIQPETVSIETMHEGIDRPGVLPGNTYKVKTPQSDHALYITINDIILNGGTEHEERRPYEIFINSKNMEHFQWVLALTRLISAVWRKGGDACFLVEEMKAVFDPKGGYFKKGGVFMPSLVAEIGCVIEEHLIGLGMIQVDNSLAEMAKTMLAEKTGGSVTMDKATLCTKCNIKAVVLMDGCMTCLSCGDSKCG